MVVERCGESREPRVPLRQALLGRSGRSAALAPAPPRPCSLALSSDAPHSQELF